MYLHGIISKVHTDHKPLIPLFKPTAHPPHRVERWLLKLMPYTFTVLYQPGNSNPADYLSRSNPLATGNTYHHTEERVNVVITNSIPVSITLDQERKEAASDSLLSNLVNYLKNDSFPSVALFAPFHYARCGFSTVNGIVLLGHRIIVPSSLRTHMIEFAHEDHQGIIHTKEHLRTKV